MDKQLDLGTSTTPVCPSFLSYIHLTKYLHMKRCISDIPDLCQDSSEEQTFQLGKEEQGSKEIDSQELFEGYWSTTAYEFPVQCQLGSPNNPHVADQEGTADILTGKYNCSLGLYFSVEVTVHLLVISHCKLLITFT